MRDAQIFNKTYQFGPMSMRVMADPTLSDEAKLLYAVLLASADGDKNFQLSAMQISNGIGWRDDTDTTFYALKELSNWKLVKVHHEDFNEPWIDIKPTEVMKIQLITPKIFQ